MMFVRRAHLARRATTVLIATALALGACGDTTDNTATPAADTTSAAPDTASATPAGGDTAPALPDSLQFALRTIDGQPFDSASLAGKPTVFWFWASWCPVCRDNAADVADLQRDYAGRINVIGIAGLSSGAEPMRKFVKDQGIGGFPNLNDDAGEVWRKFKVKMQDDFVILDSAGKVVHNGPLPDADLRKRLTELTA